MISYTKGDLLSSKAQALVNTVNTVGVMGKGIALHFKELFPYNFTVYAEACKKGELAPGKMLVVKDWHLARGLSLISPPKSIGVSPPNTSTLKMDSVLLSVLSGNMGSLALRFRRLVVVTVGWTGLWLRR